MRKLLLLGAVCGMLISCEEILRQHEINQQQQNYTNPYMGKYTGNYSGNVSGTISFEVAKSGNVTIVRSGADGSSETFYSYVNNVGGFSVSPSPNN